MAAISDAFDNDDSFTSRLVTTAAHLMLYAIALLAVMRVWRYLGGDYWVSAVGVTVAMASVWAGFIHNRSTSLCVKCMEEVPADAPTRAERRRPILWLNHQGQSLTFVGGLLAAGVVSAVLRRVEVPSIVTILIDLAIYVVIVAYLYSVWLHHRLRPWCPYCRDWDDDGGIEEPSPDPMIKATR